LIRNISVQGDKVVITYPDREKATEAFKKMIDDIDNGGTELCFMITKSAEE
jgi:hypothetical protein